MNIKNLLNDSSIRTLLSSHEIDEIAEELSSSIEEVLEHEKEAQKEVIYNDFKVEEMKSEIVKLKNILKKVDLPRETLDDVMTIEWLKKNWDAVVQMQKHS